MKPLLRGIILPILLFFALTSNATPKTYSPFFNTSILINSIKNVPTEKNIVKICACQLMDVRSTNEDLQNLVIFAEKTNNADLLNERKTVMKILRKEKKHLRSFYSEITLKKKIVVSMDCASLYEELKNAYDDLKVYGTLDADIRTAIK